MDYATFYELEEGKPPHVCRVRGCPKRRKKGRSICSMHHSKMWRSSSPMRAAYFMVKWSAKLRSIPFTLTFDEFTAFVEEKRNEGVDYLARKGTNVGDLHLDRVIDSKGYEAGNLQLLTVTENVCKEHNRQRAERKYSHTQPLPGDDPF